MDSAANRKVDMVVDAVSIIASSPSAAAPGMHSSNSRGTLMECLRCFSIGSMLMALMRTGCNDSSCVR